MPWNLNGNANINTANDYLGTRNAAPLIIRTQNGAAAPNPAAEVMRFTPDTGPVGAVLRRVGIRTQNPLSQLHVTAPGGFGGEDANGVAQAGNVPIVAQSDSTAFGILNSNGRPAFALNIDGNQQASNARGVPTLYDRFDGNWHAGLSLMNGNVGIGPNPTGRPATGPPLARLDVDGSGASTGMMIAQAATGMICTGTNAGLIGFGGQGPGISGSTSAGANVAGVSGTNSAQFGVGVVGEANNFKAFGVWGKSQSGYAGYFSGDVQVLGNMFKTGSNFFLIDHPIDPENRYLCHAAIESPEVLNVYSGNIVTDSTGNGVVELPNYFEALNRDFRYQLTVIGELALAVISEEVVEAKFQIRTDRPNVKVSWQVTGVRNDAVTIMSPMTPESEKPPEERGTYLHPEAFGQPETRGVDYAREQSLRKYELEIENAARLSTGDTNK